MVLRMCNTNGNNYNISTLRKKIVIPVLLVENNVGRWSLYMYINPVAFVSNLNEGEELYKHFASVRIRV